MSDEEEYGLTAATLYVNEDLEVISRLDADQQKRALALKEAAALIAARFDRPSSCCVWANSVIRMPFFAISPTSVTKPICA